MLAWNVKWLKTAQALNLCSIVFDILRKCVKAENTDYVAKLSFYDAKIASQKRFVWIKHCSNKFESCIGVFVVYI